MTEHQLGRTIPGFIRVEVVLSDNSQNNNILSQPSLLEYFQHHPIPTNQHSRAMYHNIPIDYQWEDTTTRTTTTIPINASICCHVSSHTWQQQQHRDRDEWSDGTSVAKAAAAAAAAALPSPQLPTANDLYFWETSIEALGVRQMPKIRRKDSPNNNIMTLNDLDWVVLLGGSNNELFIKYDPSYIIGDYWSGQYLLDTATPASSSSSAHIGRPDRKNGKYATNQGGWFGTRRQIIEWHTRWCRGSFLPYVELILCLLHR
jgi:hypothetical protein